MGSAQWAVLVDGRSAGSHIGRKTRADNNRFMEEAIAYLNGRFVPAASAAIPVTDAGFVLGAAVAEQVRTFGGTLFRFEEHLDRLEHSLQIVGIDPGVTRAELREIAHELVAANHRVLAAGDDLGLSIVVTPGLFPSYADAQVGTPTVCLHTYALPFRLWAAKYRTGQSLRTTGVEQVSARSWPPHLKCRSRMHYYLADRQAAAAEPGARAVLLDREGFITEASTANLLLYRQAEGLLAPRSEKVLNGISLQATLQLARQMALPITHCDLSPDDLAAADEAFLTSTPVCILPVTRFNGQPIGSGSPGPVFGRLLGAWNRMVGLDIASQAERFSRR